MPLCTCRLRTPVYVYCYLYVHMLYAILLSHTRALTHWLQRQDLVALTNNCFGCSTAFCLSVPKTSLPCTIPRHLTPLPLQVCTLLNDKGEEVKGLKKPSQLRIGVNIEPSQFPQSARVYVGHTVIEPNKENDHVIQTVAGTKQANVKFQILDEAGPQAAYILI
jgi:hypothetical protein